jgi:WD repeat-containing protein 19
MVVISTHMDEIGEEIFSGKFHKERLEDIAFSPVLQRAATCGERNIKVVDMTSWKELKSEQVFLEKESGVIKHMQWTKDGQILTVSTTSGIVYNFLARMPTLHSCSGTRMAYLSSLRELSVVDTANEHIAPRTVPVSIEPDFVALGPNHVAVGMNNRVWYYQCGGGGGGDQRALVSEREYVGTVEKVQLGDMFAAVLCEGKVHLHLIERKKHASPPR